MCPRRRCWVVRTRGSPWLGDALSYRMWTDLRAYCLLRSLISYGLQYLLWLTASPRDIRRCHGPPSLYKLRSSNLFPHSCGHRGPSLSSSSCRLTPHLKCFKVIQSKVHMDQTENGSLKPVKSSGRLHVMFTEACVQTRAVGFQHRPGAFAVQEKVGSQKACRPWIVWGAKVKVDGHPKPQSCQFCHLKSIAHKT